ncbi:CocE/NonD family hydrolase [Streptomyces sp. NPDC057137]|uniref:CocE/NonD family hydrolase n=1 Tax=Streptomyces sp. NPDC057137 TaxID=3346030 RepID=UPI0036274FCD
MTAEPVDFVPPSADLGLPPRLNSFHKDAGLRVPTRDGEFLMTDVLVPETDEPRGTILIRSSYGRGYPYDGVWSHPYAERGYHVVIQSVRGTFGSTGAFEPMVNEVDDAQDTVAWLREQSWFDGRLATLGSSYLGYTQFGLLMDPPPELRASIVVTGPHDFGRNFWGNGSGAFSLETFLMWSALVGHQERPDAMRWMSTMNAGLTDAYRHLPLKDAAEPVLEGLSPWYEEWLKHPDPHDPCWKAYDLGKALHQVTTPTLLIGGWYDLFLDQTFTQYETLHTRGIDVALTIGPWYHGDAAMAPAVAQQALAWLNENVSGVGSRTRPQPVHVALTGTEPTVWRDLPAWPPKSDEHTLHLAPEGRLSTAATDGSTVSAFTYDPSDPTPSLGGRAGLPGTVDITVDTSVIEGRDDVLTFTAPPATGPLDILGAPVTELILSVDNPHADVYVRLCDVAPDGASHHITDTLIRLDPAVPVGVEQHLTLTLDPCAHRLNTGHRLRLQIAGGAHPRFARNLGTDEPLATATTLRPSRHTIHHVGSRVSIPVTPS